MINLTERVDDTLKQSNWQEVPGFFEGHPRLKIRYLIKAVIPYIGTEVSYQGKKVVLSWRHMEEYLSSLKSENDDLFTSFYANGWEVFTHPLMCKKTGENFKFIDTGTARAFLDLVSQILPIRNNQCDWSHYCCDEIFLSVAECYFCTVYAMQEEGSLDYSCLADKYLLKTLRADEYDYSHIFKLGIIESGSSRRLQNLRPRNRKPYVITPQGDVIEYVKKILPMGDRQKNKFSQIQSTTFVDKKVLVQPFGFSKARSPTLYGLLTHVDDAVISRLLLQDSGTVHRPFDHPSEEAAKGSGLYKNSFFGHSLTQFAPADMDKFKSLNSMHRWVHGGTNEVMARLRFNPYLSFVCICSDTLESRLLAYSFSEELWEEYSAYAKQNMPINPHFQIPIIFYYARRGWLSNEPLKFYTRKMLLKDQEEAQKIYGDENARHQKFSAFNYGFLLGLKKITLETLLKEYNGEPLALVMIKAGYLRMLMRLLEASTRDSVKKEAATANDLREQLFDKLLAMGHFKENDPIISEFILVEAFDIADKLINATCSDKYKLGTIEKRGGLIISHNGFLWLYLITQGNPRQLRYMGLEKILLKAAHREMWQPIKLCLKEYPDLSKELLGSLLPPALRYGGRDLVKLLLKAGAKPSPGDCSDPLLIYLIYDRYNELLPAAIEFERLRHQDPARFNRACLLAREYACAIGNEEAAKILDSLRIVHFECSEESVCQLFFDALQIESPWQKNINFPEHLLLIFLHQYKLLDNEDNTIISALKLIVGNFPGVIKNITAESSLVITRNLVRILIEGRSLFLLIDLFESPLCKAFLNTTHFYNIIIDSLSESDVYSIIEFIEVIIKNKGCKEIWSQVVDERFVRVLRYEMDMPFLLDFLLRFSPRKTCDFSRISMPFRVSPKILHYVFDNFNLTQEEKDNFFRCAVIRVESLDHLDLFFQNGCDVTPRSLEDAAFCKVPDVVLALLDRVTQENFDTRFNGIAGRAFYRCWALSRTESRLQQKLLNHLDPAFLRHLTLIYLLIQFSKVSIGNVSPLYPNLQNFLNGCKSEFYPGSVFGIIPLEKFSEMLTLLEDYFYSGGPEAFHDIPDESLILATYTKILALLGNILSSWRFPTLIWGFKSSPEMDYATSMSRFMQEVEGLLTKNQSCPSDAMALIDKERDAYVHSLLMLNL
jgi:hypothetical protein